MKWDRTLKNAVEHEINTVLGRGKDPDEMEQFILDRARCRSKRIRRARRSRKAGRR